MGVRVSLCMIVKDEEANLPACLASVGGLADEVVVVDTGSTDRTRALAVELGARVFDFPWRDDFAAARNESLRHARGEWAFWLDGDDRLDDGNRGRLGRLFASLRPGDNAGYVMKCLCLGGLSTGPGYVGDSIRLFSNRPDVRWRYRVHEQIEPALRAAGSALRGSDVVILHTGYQDGDALRRKLERNLRLYDLDQAQGSDDPWVQYKLGALYLQLERPAEALPLLQRSLARAPEGDRLRDLYALLVRAHLLLGRKGEAWAACQAGRAAVPADAELLMHEALLRVDLGDPDGAEACLLRLVEQLPRDPFAAAMVLPLCHAEYNLGVLLRRRGRAQEAEARYRSVLEKRSDYTSAWMGLADLWLEQGRLGEIEAAARHLEDQPGRRTDATVLRARLHLACREFGSARALLEDAIAADPKAFWPRVALSHVMCQEGRDGPAAERALRAVLDLDPEYTPARDRLAKLTGRPPGGGAPAQGPQSPREPGGGTIRVSGW